MSMTTEQSLFIKVSQVGDYFKNPIFNCNGYRVRVSENEEMLLIAQKEVIWMKGTLTVRKLKYDNEMIVNASFANFGGIRCLVIALKEYANIYYPDGKKEVVNFPCQVKNIFPYPNGLIIEVEFSKTSTVSAYLSAGSGDANHYDYAGPSTSASYSLGSSGIASGLEHPGTTPSSRTQRVNFLTLSDPLGEFGTMVSSSTSSISSKETLVLFPERANEKLAVTYNSGDNTLSVFQVRFLGKNSALSSSRRSFSSRSGSSRGTRRPPSMRKISSSATPLKIADSEFAPESTNPSTSISQRNLESSRAVSETLSLDRMASGSEMILDSSKPATALQAATMKKEVILTRLETISAKDDRKALSFYSSFYRGQHSIIINNSKTAQAGILIFKENRNTGMALAENYVIPCLSCYPFSPNTKEGTLVLLKDDHNICLANPFISLISANIALDGRYTEIAGSSDFDIILRRKDGSLNTISLLVTPKSQLIATIFESLKYMSNSFSYEYFWMQWSAAMGLVGGTDEWRGFVVTLLSVIITDDINLDENRVLLNETTQAIPLARLLRSKSEIKYSLNDLLPKIVLTLHLIREDMKLDNRKASNVDKLSILLSQLTAWMGWSQQWFTYYGAKLHKFDKNARFLTLETVQRPLNLLESLDSLFSGGPIIPYLTFSQVSYEGDSVDAVITPRTYYVLRLFEIMVTESFGPADVVNAMIDFKIKVEDLETYPVSVAVPLKESLLASQRNTPLTWSEAALEMVGRKDILRFIHSKKRDFKAHKTAGADALITGPREINRVLGSYIDSEASAPWDGQAEADRINITKLIFSEDRRFLEITTLLQSSRVPTVQPCFTEELFASEPDKVYAYNKSVASITALRTLTIPLGRGALFLSSRLPLMTERFPIPKLTFSCIISNSEQILPLDKETIDPQVIQWGFFHNGASSGLTISRDAEDINGGWVAFNQPPAFNAQHAGFLLGLGLNGHLKKLDQWHIYNYLGPKHPYTSIGLLLGMSASLRGTMDVILTKVLSVHVLALLPSGATDLKVALSVQSAGLVGIGLLYLETQHHRMSEMLLSQLHSKLPYDDDFVADEGYRLAAGMGLGYINLGKGDEVKGLNDSHLVGKLLAMAVSIQDVHTEEQLDRSASGSILALSFIYMQTNNSVIANKLELPNMTQLLDYIRPDLALLRTLGKNIVMWDSIQNTKKWLESQIPECLRQQFELSEITSLNSDQLIYFNIIGGACLSVALKYASTSSYDAKMTVLSYLEEMIRISGLSAKSHDEKITLMGASTIRDILAISCSIIMAGSGDLEIFRRLRVLYGKIETKTSYGNFMAVNMALGFLFLGGGQYAFAHTAFAVASLVISVYPIFPSAANMSSMGTDGHLQALRHFWALAANPRCLIVRDVETSEPLQVPVEVTLNNGTSIRVQSPRMIPPLDEIATVETISADHFPVFYDFTMSREHFEIFSKSLTLYVYKKNDATTEKTFGAILNKLENKANTREVANPLVGTDLFSSLHLQEKTTLVRKGQKKDLSNFSTEDVARVRTLLSKMAESPKTMDDLWNLKILFKFCDNLMAEECQYLGADFIESLKFKIWNLTKV